MRKSGILMAVSSLPSRYGIGCFSREAYEFVDCLKKAGQTLWQILPLGPTGYGDSPYQSFSSFAGNPYFIDLEALTEEGLLTQEECEQTDFGNDEVAVDYAKIYQERYRILRRAFERASQRGGLEQKEFLSFKEEEGYWLSDYALFMALKDHFQGKEWDQWEDGIMRREEAALCAYRQSLAQDILFYEYIQYLFSVQWQKLKSYANENGVRIIGDIPIYVAFDSSDLWADPQLFQMDRTLTPTAVAGCPPDAFSATGQVWGNPLYDWDLHKKTGYAWWIRRISHCCRRYDIVRIDHFRGFDEYFSIPYGDKTAERGKWVKGPGMSLFDALKKTLGDVEIIAEDLGYVTDSVRQLLKDCGYPGLKLLQFAFDSREAGNYLPHNYVPNCVVYPGTHDNDTIQGWYTQIAETDRQTADIYLNLHGTDLSELHWDFISLAMRSVADTCIIPMQDYLGLGSEARMNIPSVLGGNWTWRMEKGAFTEELADRIRKLTYVTERI